MTAKRWFILLTLCYLFTTGCAATSVQIIPTARPSHTPTLTSVAIGASSTQTPTATFIPLTATGGPSPTPLFGTTPIAPADQPTATRVLNPNAPRIEFFETGETSIAPGEQLTLFWSIRNVERAVIYRLNRAGQRTLAYNIPPFGNQAVRIEQNERGTADFLLVAGEGALQTEERLSIEILCPIVWFFLPSPEACPSDEAQPSAITEQMFERGRMLYLEENDRIYALFNDGLSPAWVDFTNLYNPAVHPERDESFELAIAGSGLVQPLGRLGFVWRGNDTVRNRLGVGTSPETNFQGFVQRAPTTTQRGGTADSLYLTSATGTVIQLLPNGASWQILTPG